MGKALRYGLQILNYFIFVTIVWYFSAAPAYQHLAEDQALIALAFGHAGQPVGECRERTPEELAKLPPNMRIPTVCPRQRSPLEIELFMDEQLLFSQTFQAPGLSGDGAIDIYRQFKVKSGQHHIRARMKDSVRVKDFNYVREEEIVLAPTQILVIDFKPNAGGFIFKKD